MNLFVWSPAHLQFINFEATAVNATVSFEELAVEAKKCRHTSRRDLVENLTHKELRKAIKIKQNILIEIS